MLKKILTTLLVAYAGLQAYQAPSEIKYFVNINKDFKGVLLFKNSNKATDIEYFNITPRDKIPFYAPSKEFTFTQLNKQPTISTLNVNPFSKHIVYDLDNLSADEIEEADINKADIADSAIIYNKDDLPSRVLEKKPIHTIESLILSIFETKKIPTALFYLYEPHKKMLLKVKFVKEGSESLNVGDISCDTETYVLEIAGRNKRLIRVYTNGYPLKVESYSKKWSFVLAGSGKTQKFSVSNKDIAFKVFKDEVLQTYSGYNVKILSQEVQKDVFQLKYLTKFHISKALSKESIEKYLLKYTSRNINMDFVTNKKDAYIFKVDNDDVIEALEQKYDLEDDKYYWKKEAITMKASDLMRYSAKKKGCKVSNPLKNDSTLICDGEEESVDYEDVLQEYYGAKLKDFKISKVKEEKNNLGNITKIKYTLKSLHEVDNDLLYKFAVKTMQAKYPENKFTKKLRFIKSKKEWKLYISKKDVMKYACKKTIPMLQSKYKNGACQVTAQTVHTSEDTQGIVTRFINTNYKDLKILNTEIEYGDDKVSFNYLNNLKKVQNACK